MGPLAPLGGLLHLFPPPFSSSNSQPHSLMGSPQPTPFLCPKLLPSVPLSSQLTQFAKAMPVSGGRFLAQAVWDLLTSPERSAVPVSTVKGTQWTRQMTGQWEKQMNRVPITSALELGQRSPGRMGPRRKTHKPHLGQESTLNKAGLHHRASSKIQHRGMTHR